MARKREVRLSDRQQEYVDFVTRYWDKKGYGPSEADVAEHFLVSGPSAHMMIVKLCALGALIRDPGVPRSVRPTSYPGMPTPPHRGSWGWAPKESH